MRERVSFLETTPPAQPFLTLYAFLTILHLVFSPFVNTMVRFQWLENLHGNEIMKIQVGGLADGLYNYRLTADSTLLGLDERFQGQVNVDATVEKSGTQVFLSAEVKTDASFVCDRCLSPFLSPLKSSYRMYYVAEESGDYRVDPSELQIVPPGFSVIDLHEDVRQTVLLSVPLKVLCSETCKGLCPHCGTNWNLNSCTCEELTADSRWEQLKRLKKQA